MTDTLYVESSLCLATDVAGWGGVLSRPEGPVQRAGRVPGMFGGSVTLMELAAVEAAFWGFWRATRTPTQIALALRSTAAMAVLRWVFPDAPFEGDLDPPKRLKRDVREYPPLYALSDFVETRKVTLSLRLVTPNPYSETASVLARGAMEAERPTRRLAQ